MRDARSIALAAIVVAACASSGAGATAGAPDPVRAATYAPSLDVDPGAMTMTKRGTYVRDLRAGTGKTLTRGMTATMRFTGFLANGTRFDSTAASEKPISFRVGAGQAIAGWDDGVIGMRVGGRRQLVIPPALGYGRKGAGPIPPDAVLVFVVDLVDAR